MVNYKYPNVENVEAKQDFEVHKHDENCEITETIVIRKGTKGVVESMGCSSVDGFTVRYDICFKQDDNEIDVGISEGKMEELLTFSC